MPMPMPMRSGHGRLTAVGGHRRMNGGVEGGGVRRKGRKPR